MLSLSFWCEQKKIMGIENLRKKFEFEKTLSLVPKLAEEKKKQLITKEEHLSYNIIKKVVGGDFMNCFETKHVKSSKTKQHTMLIYYKEWAQAIGKDEEIPKATVRALKLLKPELIGRRDALNAVIDKLNFQEV